MDLLSINTGLLFWTVIVFILLVLILKKYAWKPILKNLEDRENTIKTAIYQAEQNQKDASELVQKQQDLLEKVRQEAADIINESKRSAELSKKQIVEQAQREADNLLMRARQEIESNKQTAIREIKDYVLDISFAAAEKVVSRSLKKEQHYELIEQSIQEMLTQK